MDKDNAKQIFIGSIRLSQKDRIEYFQKHQKDSGYAPDFFINQIKEQIQLLTDLVMNPEAAFRGMYKENGIDANAVRYPLHSYTNQQDFGWINNNQLMEISSNLTEAFKAVNNKKPSRRQILQAAVEKHGSLTQIRIHKLAQDNGYDEKGMENFYYEIKEDLMKHKK